MIRYCTMALFKRLFRRPNSRLILQNEGDVGLFKDVMGLPSDRVRLIPGSGVDLAVFHPRTRLASDRLNPPVFMMVSRLLKDKGVIELINAASIARAAGVSFEVALVGSADPGNRNTVADEALQSAAQAKLVKLYGRRADIEQVYAEADVAVLPSYREGSPKALLEAMACGLPIITTDVPGCSALVSGIQPDTIPDSDRSRGASHGVKIGTNGILVPPQDAKALAEAIGILAGDPELRSEMGQNSRRIAEAQFGVDRIVRLTFDVYDELVRQTEVRTPLTQAAP
jgi:glycosyltransferase involved in cell wall biosynthesis